jgi:hypothetical protein
LLAAGCFVACGVPDVELVDELPGGSSSGGSGGAISGGASSGGTSAGNDSGEGGEPRGSAGERASGGDAANGGDGSDGGSAGAKGDAGSGGRAGSDRTGPGGDFPAASACDEASGAFCEQFPAAGPTYTWNLQPQQDLHSAGPGEALPSSPAYATTGFKQVAPSYELTGDVKLSFWVLFEQQTDQAFVSIGDANGPPWEFGMNGDHFRFHHGGVSSNVIAPTSDAKTLFAQTGVWTCVELTRVGSSLGARVVPFKKAAKTLPRIDGEPTSGEDDVWVNAVPEPDWDASFFFGNSGNSISLDDVMIGALDEPSVCDFYLEQSQ